MKYRNHLLEGLLNKDFENIDILGKSDIDCSITINLNRDEKKTLEFPLFTFCKLMSIEDIQKMEDIDLTLNMRYFQYLKEDGKAIDIDSEKLVNSINSDIYYNIGLLFLLDKLNGDICMFVYYNV